MSAATAEADQVSSSSKSTSAATTKAGHVSSSKSRAASRPCWQQVGHQEGQLLGISYQATRSTTACQGMSMSAAVSGTVNGQWSVVGVVVSGRCSGRRLSMVGIVTRWRKWPASGRCPKPGQWCKWSAVQHQQVTEVSKQAACYLASRSSKQASTTSRSGQASQVSKQLFGASQVEHAVTRSKQEASNTQIGCCQGQVRSLQHTSCIR